MIYKFLLHDDGSDTGVETIFDSIEDADLWMTGNILVVQYTNPNAFFPLILMYQMVTYVKFKLHPITSLISYSSYFFHLIRNLLQHSVCDYNTPFPRYEVFHHYKYYMCKSIVVCIHLHNNQLLLF